jgi:predicted DNA-binding protein
METNIKNKEKTIGVRIPIVIYNYLNNLAHKQYKSISEVIRETLVGKIEDEFTIKEWALIERSLAESYKEKGVNWRKA